MTELKSKKDRSDTASLMTVDEITAEVESRRASGTLDGHGAATATSLGGTTATGHDPVSASDKDWPNPGDHIDAPVDEKDVVVAERAVELDDVEDEDDLEEDEDDDSGGVTLGGDDDDIPKEIETKFKCEPFTLSFRTRPDNAPSANKWIKGALIGAGSFGKVYLGMDASTGLLMAVKQVELPTGSLPNQERKKSMLNALEREIELLKNLQHDHIVQYLCNVLLSHNMITSLILFLSGG